MKLQHLILGCVLSFATFTGITASASDAKTVNISAYDTMKYSVTSIQVSPGEKVTVNLKNEGNMPKAAMAHNWVLLKAGTDPNAYARLAMSAKASDYQPKALASRVIASSPPSIVDMGTSHGVSADTAPWSNDTSKKE